MGARGAARRTDRPDALSLPNALSASAVERAQVGVQRLKSIAVVDHDHVTIAIIVPAGVNDHTCIRSIHSFSLAACKIDSPVIGFFIVIESREKMLVGRVDIGSVSNRAPGNRIAGARTKYSRRGGIFARD